MHVLRINHTQVTDVIFVYCFLQSGSKAKAFLKPIILEEILQSHKDKVAQLIQRESQKPMEHAKLYDKYSNLINKQVRFPCLNSLRVSHAHTAVHGQILLSPTLFTQFSACITKA